MVQSDQFMVYKGNEQFYKGNEQFIKVINEEEINFLYTPGQKYRASHESVLK